MSFKAFPSSDITLPLTQKSIVGVPYSTEVSAQAAKPNKASTPHKLCSNTFFCFIFFIPFFFMVFAIFLNDRTINLHFHRAGACHSLYRNENIYNQHIHLFSSILGHGKV